LTKLDSKIIKDSLCNDINLLISNLNLKPEKYSNDEIRKNIRKIIGELPDECLNGNKSKFYESNIDFPLLAPYNYKKLFECDRSNSIRLMGKYLRSSTDLRHEVRIEPLKYFIESLWAFEVFNRKENLKIFLNDVLIEIAENRNPLLDELKEIGLIIKYSWPDIELGFGVEIEFSRPNKSPHIYEYSMIKDLIDSATIDRLSSLHCADEENPLEQFELIRMLATERLSKVFKNFPKLNLVLATGDES